MNCWIILGIEPTTDVEAIRQAYREKLKITNPEDDPQGFMELREALENAIKAAKEQQQVFEEYYEDNDEDDELRIKLDEFTELLQSLYGTFSRRVSEGEWLVLLRSDLFSDGYMRNAAIREMMVFLVSNYHIPYRIRTLIREELKLNMEMRLWNDFPEGFVSYMMDEIKGLEYPAYEYMYGTDDMPFDDYIEWAFQLKDAINEENCQLAGELIDKMEDTGIENPMLDIDKAALCIKMQDYRGAQEYTETLLEEYEDNINVLTLQGDLLYLMEDYSKALDFYRYAIEIDSDHSYARYSMAMTLMALEEFEEAGEILRQLRKESPYDGSLMEAEEVCSHKYLEQLQTRIDSGETDTKTWYDYMCALFDCHNYDEAASVLERIGNDCDSFEKFHQMAAVICFNTDQDDKCLEHIKASGDDNMKMLEGLIYFRNDERLKAIQTLDDAIDHEPENNEAVLCKAQMLSAIYDYKGCIETATQCLEADPGNHAAYFTRAKAFYELGFYDEAYEDCEMSITLYKYEFEAHALKIKLLSSIRRTKSAEEWLNYLKEEGIKGTQLLFLEGFIEDSRENYDEAEKLYENVIELQKANERRQAGENEMNKEDLAEVYHRIVLMYFNADFDKDDYEPGAYNWVMELINKGLNEMGDHVPLLEVKGAIDRTFGHIDAAESSYKKILKIAPGKTDIYRTLADIASDKYDWDTALKYIDQVLHGVYTIDDLKTKAMYLIRKGELKEALDTLAIAFTMDPEFPEGLYSMGLIMEYKGDDDAAIQYYLEAISLGEEKERICGEAYKSAAAIYRRRKGYVQAVEMLEQGYKATEDADFMREVATTCLEGGNTDGAEKVVNQFRKIYELGRLDFNYLYQLAPIYKSMKRFDRAFDMYDMISMDDASARLEMGKILFYKGKYRKALKVFEKAIKMLDKERMLEEDKFAEGYYYLWAARTCAAIGDYNDAGKYAEAGLKKIDENYREMYAGWIAQLDSLVGALYAAKGSFEAAEEILKRALDSRKCERCPNSCCVEALYELSYLYRMQGHDHNAASCLEMAIESAPGDMDVYCAMMNLKGKRI